jgi:hypothetical protein
MKAEIGGGDDEYIKIYVTDNLGEKHDITIEKEGDDIAYHDSDGYPDDLADRNSKQNEMMDQARDYAKWHVSQETDHDTVSWYLDTGQLETIRELVSELTEEERRTHFYDFYRQLAGEHTDDITQPHTDRVPRGEAISEVRAYKLDVYLTDDATAIDTTSGVHTMYFVAGPDDRLIKGEDPYPNREPDGRLENVVIDIDWDQFGDYLDYHLRCQIRDSYLIRGEEPPAEYRVLGPGTDQMTVRSMLGESVPDYHDCNGSIEGYRAEDEFTNGIFVSPFDLL